MFSTLDQALSAITAGGLDIHFRQLRRGIEKESLRVNPDGTLAQTPHPRALGSALTHHSITTDYSEALLEFVTPIHTDIDGLLRELTDIHHYTYQNLGDEKLWVNSMPCVVLGEQAIPIARYGSSNIARMKEAYRRGLGHRYGRLMQTIAGIHYNFSLSDAFWEEYLSTDDPDRLVRERSAGYFALTRNFLRHSWLVCYLFGASPAVCKTFLKGREHDLAEFKEHSFYAPHATSLRLSGLGYSDDVQATLEICYNSLDEYVATLRRAIQTPWPPYEEIPPIRDGVHQQLNPNILQIENEFYAVVRPKQVAHSGESPSSALRDRGVQYVEVRSLDLDPFVPIGICSETVRFFDLFLLYCLFSGDDPLTERERQEATENRHRVVMGGRDPGLILQFGEREVTFSGAALALLEDMADLASILDGTCGGEHYREALAAQRERIGDPSLTPSARIMDSMEQGFESFFTFAMHQAEEHERYFKDWEIHANTLSHYRREAAASLERQEAIEAADSASFDKFLAEYFQRQNGY
ncbi:MAG: glutamate--cysteine ligase [Gammaproteobacteria bacterium]|nr:glutamate--cysteine ligase [Gammaproteobacteria bacterium]